MPIFYTDNPVNVSGSVQAIQGSIVTASIPGVVTVTATQASPVWITGNISTGPSTTPDAYTTGVNFPSSGSMAIYVSGASNTTVFGRVGTGTMGQAALVTLASDQPAIAISQSNVPAGTVTVTGTVGVWNAITGTVGVWNTVPVSQTNIPAGTLTVSQSNLPAGTQTVSGNFNVGINGTVTVSGNYNVGINGTVTTSQSNQPLAITASQDKSGNATLTTIEVGNASTQLLASNANRKGATIFSVDNTVYVAFGQTPSTTLYAAKVPSSSYYEIPYNWTGQVNAIAAVSGQTVNIQEFTA